MSEETQDTSFPAQPLSFSEVAALHERAKQEIPYFANSSLEEFSKTMKEQTQSSLYDAGLHDSKIKRFSAGLNELLKPVSEPSGDIGAAIGSLIGPKAEQYGRQIGEGLPRSTLEIFPAAAGASLLAAGAPVLGPAALIAGGAGLAGAGAYERTGSPAAAAISAGATAAFPFAAQRGSKLASELMLKSPLYKTIDGGLRIAENPSSKIAGVAERFAEYLGAQAGAAITMEGAIQGESLATTGRPVDPTTEEHLINLFGGSLPFAAFDAMHILKGPSVRPGLLGGARSGTEKLSLERATDYVTDQIKNVEAEKAKQSAKDIDAYQKTKNRAVAMLPWSWKMGEDPGVQNTAPSAPPGGFIEINNQTVPVDLLPDIARAARIAERGGGLSVQKVRNVLNLSREEAGTVLTVLENRGVLARPTEEGGLWKFVAPEQSDGDIMMENLQRLFPDVAEKLKAKQKAAEAPPTEGTPPTEGEGGVPKTPTAPKGGAPEAGGEPKTKALGELSADQKAQAVKDDTLAQEALALLEAQKPDLTVMEKAYAWAKSKLKDRGGLDIFAFERAWKKKNKPQSGEGFNFNFAEGPVEGQPAPAAPEVPTVPGAPEHRTKPTVTDSNDHTVVGDFGESHPSLLSRIDPEGTKKWTSAGMVDSTGATHDLYKYKEPEGVPTQKVLEDMRYARPTRKLSHEQVVKEAVDPSKLEEEVPLRYGKLSKDATKVNLTDSPEAQLEAVLGHESAGQLLNPTKPGAIQMLWNKAEIARRLRSFFTQVYAGHPELGEIPTLPIEMILVKLAHQGVSHDEMIKRTINLVERELALRTRELPHFVEEAKKSYQNPRVTDLLKDVETLPDYAVPTVRNVINRWDKTVQGLPSDYYPASAIDFIMAAAVEFYKDRDAKVKEWVDWANKNKPELIGEMKQQAAAALEHRVMKEQELGPELPIDPNAKGHPDLEALNAKRELANMRRNAKLAEIGETSADKRIELAALSDYIGGHQTKHSVVSSRHQDQVRDRFRTFYDEGKKVSAKEEAKGAEQEEKPQLQGPPGFVGGYESGKMGGQTLIHVVTDEMLQSDPSFYAKYENELQALRGVFGKGVDQAVVLKVYRALHARDIQSNKYADLTKKFNTAVTALLDGALGRRPSTRSKTGYETVIVAGHGLKPEDLGTHFGFETQRGAYKWLQEVFEPMINWVAENVTQAVKEGKSVQDVLAPPKSMFNFNFAEGPQEGRPTATEGERQAALDRLNEAGRRVDNPLNLLTATKKFFTRYFLNRGLDASEAEQRTNIAMRVAAMFSPVQYVRIAGLVGDLTASGKRLHGIAQGSTTRTGAASIALAERGIPLEGKFGKFMSSDVDTFNSLVTLGHELLHSIKAEAYSLRQDRSPQGEIYFQAFKAASELTPEQRQAIMESMWRTAVPQNVDFLKTYTDQMIGVRSKHWASNPEEFLADYVGLLVTGVASPADVQVRSLLGDSLKFHADWETQFAKAMYVNFLEISDAAHAHIGYLAGLDAAKHMGTIKTAITKMLASLRETDEAIQQFRAMEEAQHPLSVQAAQDVLGVMKVTDYELAGGVKFAEGPPETKPEVSAETRLLGQKPHALERWFSPTHQLAEAYPQFRPVVDLGYNFGAMARKSQAVILDPFLTHVGLGRKELDLKKGPFQEVVGNEKLENAVRDIALQKNSSERIFTDAEMRERMKDVPTKLQDAVIRMHRGFEESLPKAADVYVRAQYDNLATFTSKLIMLNNKAVSAREAELFGQQVVQIAQWTTDGLTRRDVNMLQGAQKLSNELAAKIGRPVFDAALDHVMGKPPGGMSRYEAVVDLSNRITNKPWWMPEMRLGQWMVAWDKGSLGFDSKADALAYAAKKELEGVKVNVWDKYDRNKASTGMHQTLLDWFQNVEKSSFENAMFRSKLPDGVKQLLRDEYTPGEAAWKEFTSKGLKANELPRKLAEGRESLDFIRGYIEYVAGMTNGVARSATKNRLSLVLADPMMQGEPTLKRLANDYIHTLLYPESSEMSGIKNLNFIMYLAANPSSMLVELSQPLLTLMPYMTRFSNNPWKSFGYMKKAGMDIMSAFSKEDKKLSNPEEQKMIERAVNDGALDIAGPLGDFFDAEDLGVLNLKKLASGDTNLFTRAGDILKKPLTWYLHTTRAMYNVATRSNSRIAFLTAYRMAREGAVHDSAERLPLNSPEEAYRFAIRATRATMFTGGPAGRPIDLFGRSGKWFGAVGAMYSLQGFAYSTLSMLGRLMKESLGKVEYLTPVEKKAAQKALGQMLATQFLLGGAMSLPFVGAATALAEQVLPDAEARKFLKKGSKAFAALFTDDKDFQNLISDTAMRGVASKLVGADISSKVQLGNVLGVDAYQGFSLDNLIGPSGSVFKNLFNASQNVLQGRLSDAASIGLPNAYRGIVDLVRNDGQIRDGQGRLLLKPTPLEQAWTALGFRPNSVAALREERSLDARSEQIAARRQERFHLDLAQQLMRGDTQGVRTALLAKQAEDSDYSARAGAEAVAQLAQELTEPYDPTQSGVRSNMTERQEIAALYGQQPRKTEVQRYIERKQLEQQLQIPGSAALSKTAMRNAQMVDVLMRQNPLLTRQQAQVMVETRFHPKQQRF